jgi:hypothetical protein
MRAGGNGGVPIPSRALRLTFIYEGTNISATSRPLDAIAPPTDALSGYGDEQGFWVEVRTAQDEVVYRQITSDPFRQDVEVFSPDPARPLFRAPTDRSSGIFSVLVPDLEGADYVALMSSVALSATGERTADRHATELARFPLRPG